MMPKLASFPKILNLEVIQNIIVLISLNSHLRNLKESTLAAKEKKVTPLMKQYNTIKTKYPDAMLLFRVG